MAGGRRHCLPQVTSERHCLPRVTSESRGFPELPGSAPRSRYNQSPTPRLSHVNGKCKRVHAQTCLLIHKTQLTLSPSEMGR